MMSKILKSISIAVLLSVAIFSTSSAITNGYETNDTTLQPGIVVKLTSSDNPDKPKVERATSDEPKNVIGVVTTIDESTVVIASSEQSVYVETNGEVDTYVSDINGEIKRGDLLEISPFSGILAKYRPGSNSVFGLALEDFASKISQSYTIQANKGEQKTNIAKIKINMDQKGLQTNTINDSTLEKLGLSVVGKEVSEMRVLVALIIFVIVMVAEGTILYGSISSAVTSIGRNPLARKFIKRELIKIIAVALIVMLIGLGAIYLILWV